MLKLFENKWILIDRLCFIVHQLEGFVPADEQIKTQTAIKGAGTRFTKYMHCITCSLYFLLNLLSDVFTNKLE